MDQRSELVNLYNLLKGEINDLGAQNGRILLFLITSVGTILTFGLNKDATPERHLFFLSVYFFIIPLSSILSGNRREIWKTATYMRVFMEPSLESTQWESRLYKSLKYIDRKKEKTFLTNISRSETGLVNGLNFATLIAIIISFFQSKTLLGDSFNIVYFLIPVILCFGVLVYFLIKGWRFNWAIKRGGNVEDGFFKIWEQVKREEDNENREKSSSNENTFDAPSN